MDERECGEGRWGGSVENPIESTKKLLKIKREFNKVSVVPFI